MLEANLEEVGLRPSRAEAMGAGTALEQPCSLPVCWEPHSGQDKPELPAAGLLELVQARGWCPAELSRKHQLAMVC